MQTATEILSEIVSSVESIKNDEAQRFPEAASAGDFFRQGDIYITRLESVPLSFAKCKVEKQLAHGTTKGSRHCLDRVRGVKMYRHKNPDELTGPVIEIATEATVTHPEHGDVVLPSGIYAITYQRAFADDLRRQRD